MNTFALIVAVACALASTGLAAWIWLSLDSVDEEWRGVAAFEGLHVEP